MSDGCLPRREFLRLAGAAGALAAAGLRPRRARAEVPHDLPLLAVANAWGGADVSIFCDPKFGPLYPLNNFSAGDLIEVGPFSLAPSAPAAVQFFRRYSDKILLVNGIYAATISHEAGQSLAMSGSARAHFPCLAALAAATWGRQRGLSFVSSGNYDQTSQLVGKTLCNPSLLTALRGVAGASTTFSGPDLQALGARTQARLQRRIAAATMPAERNAAAQLLAARQGWDAYGDVVTTIADIAANVPAVDGVVGAAGARVTPDTNPLFLASQVALAGYLHGATVSVNLAMGNLDQHTGFASHAPLIDSFFVGLDYFWRAAAYLGVADRVVMMTGSDFTRSPHAIGPAGDQGKDHWPGTTSCMFMGRGISGGRLLGASSDGSGASDAAASWALPLDPTTLKPAASGVRVQREHIHQEMRRVLGLQGTPLDLAYPLELPSAPLQLLG